MIRSRLDLYKKAGDEAVDDDPAYQDYPDVSLQPNVKASNFKPSEEPTIDKLRDELPDFLKSFYGEPGGLNLASAFQGIGQALLPGQKALTPEDERNLIGVQLEDAMAKKARERIAPQIEGTGRFAEQKIAGLVDKDIGGREFSRTKAFLQDIQTPVLESVQDLAEGRPIYDFSPIELTDLVFSVIDQIDAFGLAGLASRGIVRGLSSASQSLLNKIQSASSRAAKEEIVRRDPRTAMLLRDEMARIQQKANPTTEDLARQQGDAFGFMEDAAVRNLTGKRPFDDKRVGATKQYYDNAFNERVNFITTAAKKRLKELGKDKFTQKEFDAFLEELYPNLKKQQIYDLRRGVRESQGKYYTTQPFTELFNSPIGGSIKGEKLSNEKSNTIMNFLNNSEGKIFDKNEFYKDYGVSSSTLGIFLKNNPSYNKFFDQAGKKSLISNTSQIDQVRKKNKLVNDKFNQLEDFLKTQDNPNFYLESLRKKFKLDEVDPETNKQIITENNFRKYMKEQGYESKKNVLDNEDALKILRKYGLAASKTDSGLAGRYLELMFRSITDSPAEVMKNFEKKYGFKTKEFKTDKVTRDNNLKAFEKFIEDENVLDKFFGDANNFQQFAKLAREVDAANVALFDHLDKLYRRSKSENGNFHKAINKFISRFKSPRKDLNRFFNTLRLELSHEFEIAKALEMDRLEGAGFDVSTIYPSYGSFNRGLQKKREKQIRDKIFKVFSKDRSETLSTDLSKKSLQAGAQLRDIAQELDKLGITSIIPIDDPNIKNVVQNFIVRDNQGKSASSFDIFFDPKKGTGELIIGRGANEGMRGKPFSVQALKENMINRLNELYNNPEMIKSYKSELENLPKSTLLKGAIKPYSKGGPVKMAIGGDPLQNINEQQFTSDPAFNTDFFDQAVDSGQLTAFNPFRLKDVFGKIKGVVTDSDVEKTMLPSPGSTNELTPAPISPVNKEDFPFQSFTYEKLKSANAPNAAKPQDWANFLTGGNTAPISEIRESGLEQYLTDFEKYFPGKKMTKQQLTDFYETSPIGNLEIKVRQYPPSMDGLSDAEKAYYQSIPRPKHEAQGSLSLDNIGQNYREIVVKSGPIQGDSKPFVESGHFDDENVVAFTRVADYESPSGSTIATIQELQTDMLTSLRKEQERLKALIQRVDNAKARYQNDLLSNDPIKKGNAEKKLIELDNIVPPNAKELLMQSNAVKPFPNTAGKDLLPLYSQQITDLQKIIDDELAGMIAKDTPEINEIIFNTSQQQLKLRDDILDLNRALETEDTLKNVRVPRERQADRLQGFATEDTVPDRYDLKPIQLFPMVPFQKQKDYVDLIIKATIKDAQSRGIDKVGIFPGKFINMRWGKDPDGPGGKKFNDLYDKVAVQQMNNIAKKYGGNVQIESILNPDLSNRGLTYFKRDIGGGFSQLKQDQLAKGLEPEEAQLFIDEQLNRTAQNLGANQVIYTREVAPGQTMDYYVQPKTISDPTDTGGFIDTQTFDLVPLGPGDDRNAAQIIIEEYNPQEIKIPVLTFPKDEPKAKGPFFLFGKKDGGKIDSNGLVSITDIYGEY